MSQSILKMEQIVKSFGAVNVLKGVDFDLAKGEVHALVGGNGAGKSTLMKIMTGVYTKDSGKVIIKGEEKEIKSTNDAKENGIAMIFQEMSLVPSLTIAENIFLGYELKKHGMRDVKLMKQETEKVLKTIRSGFGSGYTGFRTECRFVPDGRNCQSCFQECIYFSF